LSTAISPPPISQADGRHAPARLRFVTFLAGPGPRTQGMLAHRFSRRGYAVPPGPAVQLGIGGRATGWP
jgi:hypothetical protein